jgi:methylated-DNA-[protein]-cysteine S-methyltransferase
MSKDISLDTLERQLRANAGGDPDGAETATGRLAEMAAAEGLLDVAYDLVDTPLGALLVAVTDRGLCRIEFDPEPDRDLEPIAREFGSRVLRAPNAVDTPRRELTEYFEGSRVRFDLSVDLRLAAEFRLRVMQELARVPYGTVTTYGALAAKAGRPAAARAVGTIMNRNPIPIVLPCHRVVGASGSLVGYGGGLERKERLLQLEGVLA